MKALGIEGTAHTIGAGIVEGPGKPVRVLANATRMLRPERGGIHPREAANHHAERAGEVLREALTEAGIPASDLDLVAFSQGPGLGPCLRTAATAARALALSAGKPLVGVNHCVAHLEIGRATTPAQDPVLLYASGGNTQVIAYTEGRYRVFGETLDVGVGNLLDKFAREAGHPFPGGPEVERLAREGSRLLDLPYTMKGMDVAFSGILTAALAHLAKGERLEDVAFSIQETAFAMLTEITERALAHTEKDEVVLGGGVACNERLWEMTRRMCEARGARAYRPAKPLLVDNGVMIAHLGILQYEAVGPTPMAESKVDARQRTDDVEATWRAPLPKAAYAGHGAKTTYRGAEAVIEPATVAGLPAVRKTRPEKTYRDPGLDRALRIGRSRAEARLLHEARRGGVRTPLVLEFAAADATLTLERIEAPQLKETLQQADEATAHQRLAELGAIAARLHARGIIHGDLTTSNALALPTGGIALLDFGLATLSEEDEDRGVDLHVLMEALEATHAHLQGAWTAFTEGYLGGGGRASVLAKVDEIVRRGRYRGT